MKKSVLVIMAAMFASTALGFEGARSFMPPNDLGREDFLEADGGISQAQFNAVVDRVEKFYKPLVKQTFGAKLTINRRWTDNTVNADASQPSDTNWQVNMYGGLARRPEVTEDGFAMVLCHEVGHHLGGFPFVQDWAADEGQSDTFATGACAFEIFADSPALSLRATIALPEKQKGLCDKHHSEQNGRDICYRSMVAGKSLADLLAALGRTKANFETPDTTVVDTTAHSHPNAQCRLDTYLASALCGPSKWDNKLIPGKSFSDRDSLEAQQEAFKHSCEGDPETQRPRCWFAPIHDGDEGGGDGDDEGGGSGECPLQDPKLCDLMCQMDPTQPWCK